MRVTRDTNFLYLLFFCFYGQLLHRFWFILLLIFFLFCHMNRTIQRLSRARMILDLFLDNYNICEHLRRILRGQASLFEWSRPLARTLTPRVLESQMDAKKELEKSLKTTCEDFIMSVTKLIVDPMLSFVTKVTAVKVALSSSNQNQKVDQLLAKPLRNQAFATPDKVTELVQKVRNAIQQELPGVMMKMKLYLQNPSTRSILFKPIKTNIVEAHVQVQSLLKSEYSPEEMESIGMIPIPDLQAQLDSLL